MEMNDLRKLIIKSNTGTMELSKIILGSTYFGTKIDEKTALSLLDVYADLGGTSIDTASVYGDHNDTGGPISEKIIGKWLKESNNCQGIKIMTKGGHYRHQTPHISRVSADCLTQDIEKSLRSLNVEVIDVYFPHRDNVNVPVSEIMELLHKFVIAGKIRAIGASNWGVDRIIEANAYALHNNLTPFTVSEIQWSLAPETPNVNELEHFPQMSETEYEKYLKAGIPVLAWSSQACGIISTAIKTGIKSLKESARNAYLNDITMHRIENVKAVCKQTGISPTEASLAYITCNPLPASAIIGPSSVEHLKDSMTAADINLSVDIIDQLVN